MTFWIYQIITPSTTTTTPYTIGKAECHGISVSQTEKMMIPLFRLIDHTSIPKTIDVFACQGHCYDDEHVFPLTTFMDQQWHHPPDLESYLNQPIQDGLETPEVRATGLIGLWIPQI
jgi:hypothetical protein